jgi:hypothetical protein
VPSPDDSFFGIRLDPNGQLIGAGPTFTIYEDTSQPVELPPGFDWAGVAPIFGVDYGPGITAPPSAPPSTPTLPPITEAPPIQPPTVYEPPPIEGELIKGGPSAPPPPPEGVTIQGEVVRPYERPTLGELNRMRETARRRKARDIAERMRMRRKYPPPPRPPNPMMPARPPKPGALGRVLRGAGRVLGPVGIGVDVLTPDQLGSGELPFPPIPSVNIPPPASSTLPEPRLPPAQEPPTPEIPRPPLPDVVIVEAPAPTTPRTPRPKGVPNFNLKKIVWPVVGSIFAPILRRAAAPRMPLSNFSQNLLPSPTPTATPAPTVSPDPLTPPKGDLLPSPQIAGAEGFPNAPAPTAEDQCHCQKCKRCDRRKRRAQQLSGKTANVQPFKRRMSVYSLKNLKRGGIKPRKRKP